MEGSSQLIWGMLFGVIGLAYFVYGKKQRAIVPLVTGVTLFIFPYFITNIYALVIVGCIITGVPYFVRI
jgi:hypothetical protein